MSIGCFDMFRPLKKTGRVGQSGVVANAAARRAAMENPDVVWLGNEDSYLKIHWATGDGTWQILEAFGIPLSTTPAHIPKQFSGRLWLIGSTGNLTKSML